MLNEQKRYLYPVYLLLNSGFAILFFLFLLFFPPSFFEGFLTATLSESLFCYLMPILAILWGCSRLLWFGTLFRQRITSVTRPVIGAIAIGLAIVLLIIAIRFPAWGVSLFNPPGATKTFVPLIGLGYALSLCLLIAFKRGIIFFIKQSRAESNLIESILIIGTGEKAQHLAETIDRHPQWGMRVSGFLTTTGSGIGQSLIGHNIIESAENIGAVLQTCIADMVLIAEESMADVHLDAIVHRCRLEGVNAGFITKPNPVTGTRATIEQLGELTLWVLKFVRRHPEKQFLKRFFDLSTAAVLCCLCLPFWLVVPILIRWDSPGPILFRQQRVGKNGRRFIMYKFRSMVADAEKRKQDVAHLNEMDGPAFKIKNDPRITRFGRFLRKTSLDELPQLFNVIRGDISLVGPRPPLFEEVCQYRPWEKKRLAVVQGITGFWQVSGRNEIKFDEWIKLDLLYIEHWGLMLDMVILLKTIPAVIAARGAR